MIEIIYMAILSTSKTAFKALNENTMNHLRTAFTEHKIPPVESFKELFGSDVTSNSMQHLAGKIVQLASNFDQTHSYRATVPELHLKWLWWDNVTDEWNCSLDPSKHAKYWFAIGNLYALADCIQTNVIKMLHDSSLKALNICEFEKRYMSNIMSEGTEIKNMDKRYCKIRKVIGILHLKSETVASYRLLEGFKVISDVKKAL